MIKAQSDGQLIVELPRTIIDSKNQSVDKPYFVGVGGITTGLSQVNATETSDDYLRTLKIDFAKNTNEIEIVGTYFVEKYHYAAPNSMSSLSPLKQYETGLAVKDVTCKSDFQLMIKTDDGSPACVKPNTVQKLVERGWGSLLQIPISLPTIRENNGTLSGDVVLAGGPSSLVGPKANYEVDVYATDGVTIVGKTLSDANAHYSIQLPAGNYIIYAPDYPTKQTHLVSVFSGKNTILNIVYGRGYK